MDYYFKRCLEKNKLIKAEIGKDLIQKSFLPQSLI